MSPEVFQRIAHRSEVDDGAKLLQLLDGIVKELIVVAAQILFCQFQVLLPRGILGVRLSSLQHRVVEEVSDEEDPGQHGSSVVEGAGVTVSAEIGAAEEFAGSFLRMSFHHT